MFKSKLQMIGFSPFKLFLLAAFISAAGPLRAQVSRNLTLDSCFFWAEMNYPQIVQYDLLKKSNEYNLQNADKGKLPQIMILGQATYQSEVTSVPGGAMADVPQLSKDQYKVYGEVVQPLTGISIINQQKKILEARAEIDQADVETRMYHIKQRVSDLFFGIILVQGRLSQTALAKSDIEAGVRSAEASVKFGAALRSTVDVLKAELLVIEQRVIELESLLESYKQMLGRFINRSLEEGADLRPPQSASLSSEINRPELRLFDAQVQAIALQDELINRNNRPNFSLFVQSGFGRPALNFLSNDFQPYYLGGVRLSWNLSNFYTSGRQKQIFSLDQQLVNSERETFLFNTRLSLLNQSSEMEKMRQLIAKDEEILALREHVMNVAQGQLENGVITATEYKSIASDTDRTRQDLVLHKIELLKFENQYRLTAGN